MVTRLVCKELPPLETLLSHTTEGTVTNHQFPHVSCINLFYEGMIMANGQETRTCASTHAYPGFGHALFLLLQSIRHTVKIYGNVSRLSWRGRRAIRNLHVEGEVERGLASWKDSEKEHLGEELSDVLLYLIRLSDICGIDLGDAANKKIFSIALFGEAISERCAATLKSCCNFAIHDSPLSSTFSSRPLFSHTFSFSADSHCFSQPPPSFSNERGADGSSMSTGIFFLSCLPPASIDLHSLNNLQSPKDLPTILC
ncbi:hypothetical protein KSP40_PGU001774 [Platanthera guangdongensis]|uniref:Uncharacterized protein n=1 Tax=Platanthera guangdongensis TaxID=2320717 RepID=A0ABR2MTE9_9ASPA